MTGQITSKSADRFAAESDGETYRVSARGVLKKNGAILVGDYVEFDGDVITRVFPRRSRFIRPNVANAECVIAVISPEPKPDFLMIDKLVVSANKEDVPVIFAVNKSDIGDGLYRKICDEYRGAGVEILSVSATDGKCVPELAARIGGRLAVLAGQSATGKSSLVNALLGTEIKTGGLSEIGRGKHTTTASAIYTGNGLRLIDTPGFAVLEADISADELALYYPEFAERLGKCAFRNCSHTSEPSCAVRECVGRGEISEDRYKRYLTVYSELKNRRKIYEQTN